MQSPSSLHDDDNRRVKINVMVGEKKVDLKKDEKKIEDVDCKCYADQRGQGGSCPRIQNVTHPLVSVERMSA